MVKKFFTFKESEGSLLCSYKPTSGPYLEPEELSSEHHNIAVTFDIILPSTLKQSR
jgi:hypothetical protein